MLLGRLVLPSDRTLHITIERIQAVPTHQAKSLSAAPIHLTS